jgi:CheY-like chemotaxis protein
MWNIQPGFAEKIFWKWLIMKNNTDRNDAQFDEKRQYPRLDIKQAVKYRVTGIGEVLTGRIENISGGGLRLHTPKPLKDEDRLSIEFVLPGNLGTIMAGAKVVWSRSASDSLYEITHVAGIVFEKMQEKGRVGLIDYIERRMRAIRARKETEAEIPDTENLPAILVVDDDPDLLAAMKEWLGQKYKVMTALDGYDAVKIASEKKPDLIFLDLKLPVVDGFSVLLMLKSNYETQPIPVVILSAVSDKKQIVRAGREGAVGYITKPFDLENLLKKIDQIIPPRENSA